jgi:GNAT superfamily N-acetyltransferase
LRYITRQVDVSDAETRQMLILMHKSCFPSGPMVDFDTGIWWITRYGNKFAAFAGLHPAINHSVAGYLCRAGVMEGHRGKGLQGKLIRTRIAKGRLIGLRLLVTDTTDNVPSMNNLIACGFLTYTPAYCWAFSHSVYWRKAL